MADRLREPFFLLVLLLSVSFLWVMAWSKSMTAVDTGYMPPAPLPKDYFVTLKSP